MTKLKYSFFLRQFSIVSIFEQLNLDSIPLDEVRGILLDTFGTESKPFISQFPEILAVILPQYQINILAEGKRLQIVDSKAGEFEDRNIPDFLRIVHRLNILVFTETKAKMTAYGFNFHGRIIFGEKKAKIDSANKLIKLSIKDPNTLSGSLKAKLLGSSFRTMYERGGVRFDMKIDPDFGSDLTPSPRASVGYNAHFNVTSFPEFSKLQAQFRDLYKNFESDLRDILTLL